MDIKPTIWFIDQNGNAVEVFGSRQLAHIPRIGESVKFRYGVQNVVAKVRDVVHVFGKDTHQIEVCLGSIMVNTGG